MKKIQLAIIGIALLIMGACSNDQQQEEQPKESESVGFSLTGDSIEEAANVPAEEKEQILQVFETYVETFNEKNLDAYMDTLAENTESFTKEDERKLAESTFNDFDLIREASDVTIVKYSEEEAQVFAKLKSSLKQLSTGLETKESGRQVTVFTKENGQWRVASVHYIGDDALKTK